MDGQEKFSLDRDSFIVGKTSASQLCGISRQAFDTSHTQRCVDLGIAEEISPQVWLFYREFIEWYAPYVKEVRRRIKEGELGQEYGYSVDDYEKFKQGEF